MEKYNENDYKVIKTYKGGMFKKDILNGATLQIKGATFTIERVYTRNGKPTRIFKFTTLNEFVDNDTSKELIEIGWNNAPAGFVKIGKELGLTYEMGSSHFKENYHPPYFIDQETEL